MNYFALGSAVLGTALITRLCMLSRVLGVALIAFAMAFLFAGLATAAPDQTLQAADGGEVTCSASAKDLTRISLVEDEFAAVSKINTGNPSDDFSVVNEPVRGDIYLSVPDGFSRPALSFFATSKRGYVYKFVCRVSGDQAVQVFINNPAIAKVDAGESLAAKPQQTSQEAAIDLVQAMYANRVLDGYEMRQRSLRPVYVGNLKVQMIADYRGDALTGRVLRIENKGQEEAVLTEASVAPASTLAVSIVQPKLAAGQATTAYLVSRTGN